MVQIINTNSLSLITQNNINKDQSALSSSIERLPSGLRTSNTKDDVTGQAITSRLISNIKGPTQAVRNANDGISVTQVVENALSEISSNLQRIHKPTIQVSTGTNSDLNLNSIRDEIRFRLDEVDRVSGQTQFNGVDVLAKDGLMKIQAGVSNSETITIDLKKIDFDTLGLSGFSVNGKSTITNRAATVNDLISVDAKSNTATGLYDLKIENTLLTTNATFNKLGNDDKVTVGGVDCTYNAKSGDLTTTKSIVGTGVSAAMQAIGSVKRRDALVATLYADAGKPVNGSYTTKDGTVSFETGSAGNITIDGSQAYVDDAGNLTTSNAGSAAKADMKMLLKTASEGNDGIPLTFNGTEYTITKTTPVTTSSVVPLVLGGITYQATVSKGVVLNETKAVVVTSSITSNPDILSKAIGFIMDESNDAAKSYVDDKGGITNVVGYTVSCSVNKDNGPVTVTGYASAIDTNKDYAPVISTAVNVNPAGRITIETTNAGSATTNPLAALDDVISSIDKSRFSLSAIQNRPDSVVTSLNSATVNLSEAQSRIQDIDYATEVSNMPRVQIVQQIGNSVLAKANQVLQQALSPLQG